MNYTPQPAPFSYHIPDYGLHGPVVDGILLAKAELKDFACSDNEITYIIANRLDKLIERMKK